MTVGDFNTPLTSMGRSSRQKVNKETMALNDILGKLELISIYKTFIQKQQKIHSLQMHVEYSPGQITC